MTAIPQRYQDTAGSGEEPRTGLSGLLHRIGVASGFIGADEPRLSWAELKDSYERPPSFAKFLPIRSWDPRTRLFRLQNHPSVAAILDVHPVDAEARSPQQLENMLDSMVQAFSTIPQRARDPWVVQLYLQDEMLLDAAGSLTDYARQTGAPEDEFSEHFLRIMRDHLIDIGRAGGIFDDPHIGVRWGGRMRRCRLVLFRRFDPASWPNRSGRMPEDELDDLARNLSHGLRSAGIGSHRIGPGALTRWLLPWLNPTLFGQDCQQFLTETQDEDRIADTWDLAHSVMKHMPRSDTDHGTWWFSGQPHRYLPVAGFRTEPRAGLLTLERQVGRSRRAAFFDSLPPETVFHLTMVFVPQDQVTDHLGQIERRSRSDNAESILALEEIHDCRAAMAQGNLLLPMSMGFFARGRDPGDLNDRMARIASLCQEEGMEPIDPDSDLFPLDEYIRYLPAAYHPEFDRYLFRERMQWLANGVAASPLWGKSAGTGRPGHVFFDRAGQPVMIDILNEEDRDKAAHCLLIGPTGSGKSATLNYLALQTMSLYRPHLFILDVGDSFRLLGDYFRDKGLRVNYVHLDRGDVSLPPFASSGRMLEQDIDAAEDEGENPDRIDFLREMEAAARMIITGCDPQEEAAYSRQDRTYVQAALIDAALEARERGAPHSTVSDLVRVLGEYSEGRIPHGFQTPVDEKTVERIRRLHDNARLSLEGVRRRLFDQPGEPWPEVDCTIVDFGQYALEEDSRDILSIAFISMMNRIQRDAERRRGSGSGRQSVVIVDEAHFTTSNPLLAGYLVRGSKMWRKWGLWLWMATQSLADFSEDTRQMLQMCEFWITLSPSREEIEEIARFRRLEDEERQMLQECRKASGRYSEGALLSGRAPVLIRVVPPAIAMALAETEESEVGERRRLMETEGLSTELQAVERKAQMIRERRLG